MTRLTRLLLAGAAVPLVLAAHPHSHSAAQTAVPAASELMVAQASERLRERLRDRREGREERRERRGRDSAETEEYEAQDADEDAEQERAAQEEADRRRAEREAAERERAAEEEAERERAAQEAAERERAAREEAERQRAAEEEAQRQRAEAEAERERAAQEAAERERAAREEAEREGERAEEEPALRERLRERRPRERAEQDTEPTPDAERAEEPIGEPTEETADEAEERPGLGERIRRSLMGEREAEERRPETAEPTTARERERLRERRQRDRADEPARRERAREAQRELDEIAEERQELREEMQELRRQREAELERIERDVRERGQGEVVQRRGDRVIIRSENNYFIQNNDMRRFMQRAEDVETRRRDDRHTETVVRRRDGTRVVTVVDEYGDIVLRTRILADGSEIVLIDNRRRESRWRERRHGPRIDYYSDVLPPLVINIPREEYIVETGRATRRDIRRALTAPPVERVTEAYSLDDVLYNERIRDMVPRVDLDTVTFEFDSAEVPDDQIDTLEEIGLALEEIIAENPRELFLLEGHTDWPGSHEYNLALSDRRAENVAIILTEFFDIPPENLITQGYGKQYLKIQTEAPERRNRRVTVRRITDLMAEAR